MIDPTVLTVAAAAFVLAVLATFVFFQLRKPVVVRGIERRLDAIEQSETSDAVKERVIRVERQLHKHHEDRERVERAMTQKVDELRKLMRESSDRLNRLIVRENQRQEFIKNLVEGVK